MTVPLAHHLELRVTDLPSATLFWESVLGCPPLYKTAVYSLFVTLGWELLLLPGPPYPICFGLRLSALSELELWAVHLKERDIPIESKTFVHPILQATEQALNVYDPDGHRFSLYCLTPL